MFWTDEELKELKGTEIIPRIGKQKSEQQYREQLLPLITTHPELFDPAKCDVNAFHRMGSLVLAYSFGSTTSSNDDDDDSEEEGNAQIAMVPLADMLNADPLKNNVPRSKSEVFDGRLDYFKKAQDGK
jgi:SET domain-containing protein 6